MSVLTFGQFLRDRAAEGDVINTVFEERLFEQVDVLQRVAGVFREAGLLWELVGGLAVLIHVEEVNPELSSLTRDVDLMVRREDIELIKITAARHGFRPRHTREGDMLMYGAADSARSAVHLVFSGEFVRPDQTSPNPPIQPVRKQIHGSDVMLIPVGDLVRMKLSAYRLKDQVHIKTLDAAGLITPSIESNLPAELKDRLRRVRETE
jgi:hypothetical protein